MTKEIFGVKINDKEELDSARIKEDLGYIPNSEITLYGANFITEESLAHGTKLVEILLPEL
jgi:hypothetical protein